MLFSITATPLFLVTIIELARNRRVQAAAFVRTHIGEFLGNEDMRRAFHERVCRYRDADWEEVAELASEFGSKDRFNPEVREQVWQVLCPLNKDRQEGARRYHPMFFQRSLEERRPDMLLHYFDLIAYHWRRGVLDIKDISGVAGYRLSVIKGRKVIQCYLTERQSMA